MLAARYTLGDWPASGLASAEKAHNRCLCAHIAFRKDIRETDEVTRRKSGPCPIQSMSVCVSLSLDRLCLYFCFCLLSPPMPGYLPASIPCLPRCRRFTSSSFATKAFCIVTSESEHQVARSSCRAVGLVRGSVKESQRRRQTEICISPEGWRCYRRMQRTMN